MIFRIKCFNKISLKIRYFIRWIILIPKYIRFIHPFFIVKKSAIFRIPNMVHFIPLILIVYFHGPKRDFQKSSKSEIFRIPKISIFQKSSFSHIHANTKLSNYRFLGVLKNIDFSRFQKSSKITKLSILLKVNDLSKIIKIRHVIFIDF